jgi:hypothetical protein
LRLSSRKETHQGRCASHRKGHKSTISKGGLAAGGYLPDLPSIVGRPGRSDLGEGHLGGGDLPGKAHLAGREIWEGQPPVTTTIWSFKSPRLWERYLFAPRHPGSAVLIRIALNKCLPLKAGPQYQAPTVPLVGENPSTRTANSSEPKRRSFSSGYLNGRWQPGEDDI